MVQPVSINPALRRPDAPPPPRPATPDPVALAERVLADNTQRGRRDMPEVARDLDAITARDPALGAAVAREVDARLTPVQRGELARASYDVRMPDGGTVTVSRAAMSVGDKFRQPAGSTERRNYDRFDRIWGDGNPATNDTIRIEAGINDMLARGLTLTQVEAERAAPPAGPSTATLVADLSQLALDITGIVDPTPISDGSNAVISVGRAIGSLFSGEGREALGHLGNGVLSVAGIIPLLGDAAKLGKIGKWAQTVSDAVGAVARNPAARAALEPVLRQIHEAVKKIPQGALDALPASARESLERMRGQLDEFFGAGARVFSDTVTSAATRLGISPERVQDIVDAGRGNRPDVNTYMTAAQQAEHLGRFDDGIIRFTSRSGTASYGTLGPPGGFVMPAGEFKTMMDRAKGDLALVERQLGLDAGTLRSDDTLIALIERKDAAGLRVPNGNEGGANSQWIPGGVTSGGISEAVMDFARTTPYREIRLP